MQKPIAMRGAVFAVLVLALCQVDGKRICPSIKPIRLRWHHVECLHKWPGSFSNRSSSAW